MNEQLEFAKEIARRLDSAGIPYMMTGSVALTWYARPRMTRDIDVVIDCSERDAEAIVRLFESDCYLDAETVRRAIAGRGMFNIIHNEWIIKADFVVRKDQVYREVELGRRRQLDIEGTPVWVVAPEDLILSKLQWSRDAESQIQKDDARMVIRSVEDLDWAYLDKWAADLGLQDLLTEVSAP